MRRFRLGGVLIACCIAALGLSQGVSPQPLTLDGAAAHVYKKVDDVELRLHVFAPPDHSAASRRPAIVLFFGGGWRGGTVQQFVPQATHLAARGMVVILVDYRVSARHKTTPFDSMSDAKSAIRWVRSRATDLGIDATRIAAGGGSSGGHIALSAAVISGFETPGEDLAISSRPDALVLFNPPVDTSAIAPFGDRGKEGSPLHHLGRNLPPMLILHGKADATVPFSTVEQFCAEARKLENRCELVGYDDAPHGFFNRRIADGKWANATLMEADRFLTSLGYLPSPTPGKNR